MKEKTIQQRAKESLENFVENYQEEKEEQGDEYEADALEAVTGKDFNQTRTYMILLGTGGPAMRITGDLNEYGEPETADYQFQDWNTPWTSARPSSEQEEILLEYARNFYFEE